MRPNGIKERENQAWAQAGSGVAPERIGGSHQAGGLPLFHRIVSFRVFAIDRRSFVIDRMNLRR